MSLPSCQKRGPRPGDVTGTRCDCGHTNLVHDDGGCVMCALRAIAPAADPQPPTLREQVRVAFYETGYGSEEAQTDAVLAVVADWLAAQPLAQSCGLPNGEGCFVREQRDHDVRLLRGES